VINPFKRSDHRKYKNNLLYDIQLNMDFSGFSPTPEGSSLNNHVSLQEFGVKNLNFLLLKFSHNWKKQSELKGINSISLLIL